MADVEFFFDPICPWAWITSRFTVEVARQRDLKVEWRLICLRMVNEQRDYGKDFPPAYANSHTGGMKMLRVAAATRERHDNDAVGRFYTELGTRLHDQGRSRLEVREGDFSVIGEAVQAAGLDPSLEAAADSEAFDAFLRSETDTALSRTGKDVGTPIITLGPGTDHEASAFGPVLARIPRGDEALQLWDAMATLSRAGAFAELKRSARPTPDFS
jgi:2-hydroxychromene-2-carboxylate isomerase